MSDVGVARSILSRTIVLIGYRGCGKTTVGSLLAKSQGTLFLDTDKIIVDRTGKSITEIFVTEGESGFRKRESDAIREATRQQSELVSTHTGYLPPIVISLGGGAVETPENLKLLPEDRCIVWLTAPPMVLADRLTSDPATTSNRPPLTEASSTQEIEMVLARRTPLYRQWADMEVSTEGRNPADIVSRIVAMDA